ncbi:MAG: MFS transporter [Microbacteriaceae bacterium]|nr:MFS transporter [Microbacteriaceae bacterium]
MSRSPKLVLAIAGLAYLIAVTQRSSLGVATLIASERFDTNAQQLATLAVFQLVVYAGMQIPVGILLDRFGAKRLLIVGALIMAIGSFTVALAPNLGTAIFGRMLVGMGDSFTFISMIRMVNGWYHGAKASSMQQNVSTVGQLGQFLSAVPFWFLLESTGWTSVSLVVVILLIAFTSDDDSNHAHVKTKTASLKIASKQLVENIKNPGIRMAFWTHFVTQPTTTSVSLLWAVPFLVTAENQSHDFAALTLTSMVIFGLLTGPIIGRICARHPEKRALIVYLVVGLTTLTWLIIISIPGQIMSPLLLVFFLLISIGGPASMIAFDFTKDIVSKDRLGSANGFANVGGFLASFVMMYLTGLVIDIVQATTSSVERYTIDAFRWGFASQLLVVAVGIVFFTLERRKHLQTSSDPGNSSNQPAV